MALSKHLGELDFDSVFSRINYVYGDPLETNIHKEEIQVSCCVNKEGGVSVELIHHMLAGPNMDYRYIEVEESFEAFDFLRQQLLDELKSDGLEILSFEDRKNRRSNIICVVVLKP